MLKGLSLPINTMILLVIAVIVLLALVFMISGGINPPTTETIKRNTLQQCCVSFVMNGCESSGTNLVYCNIPEQLGGGTQEIYTFASGMGMTQDAVKKACKCT